VVKVLRKIGHAIEDQRWMLGTDYERVKKEEGIGGRAMFMYGEVLEFSPARGRSRMEAGSTSL
jgi:hypothetical protein